jgi:hypothetical protein
VRAFQSATGGGGLISRNDCIVPMLKLENSGSNVPMGTYSKSALSNIKLMFETALTVISSGDSSALEETSAILWQTRPLKVCQEGTDFQKQRALNDAASALARLWKR